MPELPPKREMIQRLAQKVGGSFRLSTLLQKRVRDLVNGAPPLVDAQGKSPLDIAFQEVELGLLRLVFRADEDKGPKVVAKKDE
ncbi:MAG: DNA-directed RNA polymerase subunit omega [Planctomycetes bacterium]|nr:DNA-directed RNA polymerase subunit omega [Planctomycetota bacterium]